MANIKYSELSSAEPGEPSSEIRKRVLAARQIQTARYENIPGIHCNAQMTPTLMRQYATPSGEDAELLRQAMNRFQLSARAYDRILRVARTIADLEGSPDIKGLHIGEAVGYRNMDRSSWGE